MKYYLRIAGMLLVICAITALVVAGVNAITTDKIEENNIKKMNDTITDIFGEGITTEALTLETAEPVNAIYEVRKGDTLLGYAVHTMPVGFKAEIEMMVGFDTELNCKAVRIINLSETPGLGSRVEDPAFLDQFKGKNFDAISGATISSMTVKNGVDSAREALEKGGLVK